MITNKIKAFTAARQSIRALFRCVFQALHGLLHKPVSSAIEIRVMNTRI